MAIIPLLWAKISDLGIVINQSLRSSAIAYLGVIVGYVNLLVLFPYYLSSEQIGLMRLVQSVAFLMATFGQFGLPQSVIRFFPEVKENKGFLLATLVGGYLGCALLGLILLAFESPITSYFSERSALFTEYLLTTFLITVFLVQFKILEAFSRSHLKTVMPNFVRDVQLRLFTLLLVLAFASKLITFDQMVKAMIIMYLSMAISMIIYLKRLKLLSLSVNFRFLRGTLFKRIFRYALYAVIGASGTQIVLQIDAVMVSGELGLTETGIYTIAFFIGVVIEIPMRAIGQVTATLISRASKDNDMAATLKIYRQTSINQMILGTLLLIGIWANLENIYQLIPNGDIYRGGMGVVLFIGLGKLSDMSFGVNGEIIVMSKHYRFNVLALLTLSVLTIVLNLLLIPEFGLEGAAIASFLAMLTFNLIKFIFVWVKFRIQPFTMSTIKFLGIAIIAVLINYLIPDLQMVIPDILVRSTAITLVILGLSFLLKISPEGNAIVRRLQDNFFRRKRQS